MYLTFLLRMPALFMTSLIQTPGDQMAAPAVLFSRLSNFDFQQAGPEIEAKTAVCVFYSIPIDKTCDAFFPLFSFRF